MAPMEVVTVRSPVVQNEDAKPAQPVSIGRTGLSAAVTARRLVRYVP
ncbi:hypothetical protein BLAT2472_70405 [Burkholderia latens]